MKKLTVMVACAALLLGGGCFLKVSQMNDEMSNSNVLAFTQNNEGGGESSSATVKGKGSIGPCYLIHFKGDLDVNAIAKMLGIPVGKVDLKGSFAASFSCGDYRNCESGSDESCTPVTCEQVYAQFRSNVESLAKLLSIFK